MLRQLIAVIVFVPVIVSANEWKGEGELGFTSTSGNTDSENLNAKLGLSKETEKWKHSAVLQSIKAKTDNVSSADSFLFIEKSEYKLQEHTYLFSRLRYEDDRFSGYDYQASLTIGVGRRFINSTSQTLDMSAGIGYRQVKDSASRETDDEGIFSGDARYEFKISKTATFNQDVLVEAGEDNTYTQSNTALKTRINGNLASKINYQLKRNSEVPPGTEKTDKVLTVSLVYSF